MVQWQWTATASPFLNRWLFASSSALLAARQLGLVSNHYRQTSTSKPTSVGSIISWRQSAPGGNTISFSDHRDCPLCTKYGSGPCGHLFLSWLDCTDQHQSDYVVQCSRQFQQLHDCLAQNAEYYDTDNGNATTGLTDAEDNENASNQKSMESYLLLEWQELFENEILTLPKAPFPKTRLSHVFEHTSNMIAHFSLIQKELVCAFCRCEDTGVLLTAASKSDLVVASNDNHSEKGDDRVSFTVHVPYGTRSLTVMAVYEHMMKGSKSENDAQFRLICYEDRVSVP